MQENTKTLTKKKTDSDDNLRLKKMVLHSYHKLNKAPCIIIKRIMLKKPPDQAFMSKRVLALNRCLHKTSRNVSKLMFNSTWQTGSLNLFCVLCELVGGLRLDHIKHQCWNPPGLRPHSEQTPAAATVPDCVSERPLWMGLVCFLLLCFSPPGGSVCSSSPRPSLLNHKVASGDGLSSWTARHWWDSHQ